MHRLQCHTNKHKRQPANSVAGSLLKRTVWPPSLFQFSWRKAGLLLTFKVWVPEMICTIWSNPLPGMESLYVGRRIVMSILGQLWANLRMFEYLWKRARVNIVFFLRTFCCLIVLFLWLDRFFLFAGFCASLLPSATWCREVKCSKGLCVKYQQQNRTGGSSDTSNAQQHTKCRCKQCSPLPGGYSLLGRHVKMSLSKLMSQEYIIVCYL